MTDLGSTELGWLISRRFWCAAAAGLGLVAGCAEGGGSGQPLALSQVQSWAYQLQGLDESGAVEALVNSAYDLVVIEPTRTNRDSLSFDTRGMVERLKAAKAHDGIHRKLVIGYINIGEAENWRWYWTWSADWPAGSDRPADWPDYILVPDPDGWAGDFPVAYWDARWKSLVITGEGHPAAGSRDYVSMVDELIRDGFDGAYLDWVEGYEDASVQAAADQAGVDPAEKMIQFIGEIRAYARTRNPDFLIIQQNAAALIDDHKDALLKVIDAIAQEAVWFDGSAFDDWDAANGYDEPTDAALTAEYIACLDQFRATGRPVFCCEYAVNRARDAYSLAAAHGYIAYATRRPLSRLSTTPPPG